MKIGIHRISMSTTAFALPLAVLAKAQEIDPSKYEKGLGQYMMSVPTLREDPITLGVDAALRILDDLPELKDKIDLILWATESAIDHAKAGAIFAHKLLGLSDACRSMEFKQACYSGTFALKTAVNFIKSGDSQYALVIASDIARYQRHTPAESSQGAAAVAMLVCANPDILICEPESTFMTFEARDFYRPVGYSEPIVDGKYSCALYLKLLGKLWKKLDYQSAPLAALCCHTPLPKIAEKAAEHLDLPEFSVQRREASLYYARLLGNSYTAALFVSLCSLLDNSDLTDKNSFEKILCYSYGSGATAELFILTLQPGAAAYLYTNAHKTLLEKRQLCSMEQYASWHQKYPLSSGSEGKELSERTQKTHTEKGHPYYRLPQSVLELENADATCLAHAESW